MQILLTHHFLHGSFSGAETGPLQTIGSAVLWNHGSGRVLEDKRHQASFGKQGLVGKNTSPVNKIESTLNFRFI